MFPTGPVTVTFMGTTVLDRILEIEEFPEPNDTSVVTSRATEFGGRAAAPAATFAVLGGRAKLFSVVGNDFTSSGFEDFLVASGVNISLLVREAGDECYITNTYIESRSRETLTYFEPRALGHPITTEMIDALSSAEALYISGYYSHEGLSRAAEASLAHKVPVALGLCNGIVPYASRDLLRVLVKSAHVVSFNDSEWKTIIQKLGISRESELFEIADFLECIYHTRGAAPGSGFLRDGREFEIPIRTIAECVSTVGAGDTFMAGFLYGRMLGMSYIDSAHTGSLLASMKVETTLGSTFPIREKAKLEQKLATLLRQAGILRTPESGREPSIA